MARGWRGAAALLAAGVAAAGLPGCATEEAERAPALFPVTVSSCGADVTVTAAPRRVVVHGVALLEVMAALGLADRVVATTGVGANRLPAAEFDAIPVLSDGEPTLEQLAEVRADFLLGGWLGGLNLRTGITPAELSKHRVGSYAISESCRRVQDNLGPATTEEWFGDVRAIGALFGVPDRAEALVAQWQGQLAATAACLPPEAARGKTVLTLTGAGMVAGVAGGLTLATDLNQRAGGRNALADVPRSWTTVPWDRVAAADPDLLVVVDTGTGPTPDELVGQLRSNPAVSGLPAVAGNRILVLPATAAGPGTRVAEGVARTAGALHPGSCPA